MVDASRAALAAHHQGGLAGIGAEGDLAVDALRDVAGERGLAGAGVSEQAEDRTLAAAQPRGNGRERGVLLRRPAHARAARASARRLKRMPTTMIALPRSTKRVEGLAIEPPADERDQRNAQEVEGHHHRRVAEAVGVGEAEMREQAAERRSPPAATR